MKEAARTEEQIPRLVHEGEPVPDLIELRFAGSFFAGMERAFRLLDYLQSKARTGLELGAYAARQQGLERHDPWLVWFERLSTSSPKYKLRNFLVFQVGRRFQELVAREDAVYLSHVAYEVACLQTTYELTDSANRWARVYDLAEVTCQGELTCQVETTDKGYVYVRDAILAEPELDVESSPLNLLRVRRRADRGGL